MLATTPTPVVEEMQSHQPSTHPHSHEFIRLVEGTAPGRCLKSAATHEFASVQCPDAQESVLTTGHEESAEGSRASQSPQGSCVEGE